MKKILFIEATASKGGIETFILNTCKHLDKKKYNITVLADCSKCSIENDLIAEKIKIRHIPPLKSGVIKYIVNLWKTIDSRKYDIVHINKNSLSDPIALIICKLKKIPQIIVHSHNTHPTANSSAHVLHEFFRKILLDKNIGKIACSEQAGEWMFGKNNHSYMLLKNGIELKRFSFNPELRNKVRNELNLSDSTLAVCNVGRLSEQKNPLFLIEIMNSLLKIRPDTKLFIIGKGELENAIKKKVNDLGIEKNVVFLGNRSDINELLQGMDIFLMPSLYEGLPIAGVEAQASSLPLLISDTVDKGIKLLNSTEFESLNSSSDVWAKHCLELVQKFNRRNVETEIRNHGYDIEKSTSELEKFYCKGKSK